MTGTKSKGDNQDTDTIRSVNRAVALIEELADEHELGVSALATKLGINKATTFRLLSTLKAMGYVVQDGNTDLYRLTMKLFETGSKVANRIDTIKEARPLMEGIAAETQETVHLAIRDGISVVYVDKIDSKHLLRMFSRVGNRAPSWCTGVGKALLSDLSEDVIDQLFSKNELVRFTSTTITDLQPFKQELRETKIRGYAVDNEEHETGLLCVAALLKDHHGHGVAALSVSWPVFRNPDGTFEKYRRLVCAGALEASRRIGWDARPDPEPIGHGRRN